MHASGSLGFTAPYTLTIVSKASSGNVVLSHPLSLSLVYSPVPGAFQLGRPRRHYRCGRQSGQEGASIEKHTHTHTHKFCQQPKDQLALCDPNLTDWSTTSAHTKIHTKIKVGFETFQNSNPSVSTQIFFTFTCYRSPNLAI